MSRPRRAQAKRKGVTAFKRALDSGSKIVDPMDDKDWGERCGGVQDPFGHIWYIATPLKNASH